VALFARVSPSQQMRDLRATSGKLPHEKYGKFSSTGLRHFGAKNRISTDRRIGVRGPPIEKKCRRPTTWSELSGGPNGILKFLQFHLTWPFCRLGAADP
jgi:hypothetical protein